MASTNQELINEIRSFGQYSTEEISDSDIEVAISRAKNHLEIETGLDSPDWYGAKRYENALFWTSMLFTKVQTGALDAKTISVGAVSEEALLAAEEGEVTLWYRKYDDAKTNMTLEERGSRTTRTTRTTVDGLRHYERDEV